MSLSADLINICRLCLCQSQCCTSLLENKGDEIIEALTSIKIRDYKDLSTVACIKCWLNIKLAYRIQQEVIENNNKLIEICKNRQKLDENGDILHQFQSDFVDSINNIKIEKDVEDFKIDNLDEASFFVGSYCSICNANICDSEMLLHIKNHFSEAQKCDECELELENAENHQQHLITEHNISISNIFVCDTCSASFKYKCFYKMHLEKAHNVSTTRKSNHNEISTEIEIKFEQKLRENSTDENDLHCSHCKRNFKTYNNLLLHEKRHKRKRCPICNFEVTPDNFRQHVKNHSNPQVICSICGRFLKNEASLRGHIYHVHSNRSYPCPHCDKTYRNNYHRILHIRREHTQERNFVCELCGKAFYTEYVRTQHNKRVHLKKRDFVCRFCNRGFTTRSAMRTHERQHTNETPYRCDVCGEGFRQNVSLKSHKKSKHKIVEQMTESCSICGKLFSSKAAIQSHFDKMHL